MKWMFVVAALAGSAHADNKKWSMHGGGSNSANGQSAQVTSGFTEVPASKDQIEIKCESHSNDKFAVAVPCRGISLVLKTGSKIVESADLNPKGEFIFEKLSPTMTYSLELRRKDSTTLNQMDGMKGGRIYTFALEDLK